MNDMALVTPKALFERVQNRSMAIGAFNVHNMDYVQAVVKAAELENAPVILMLGEPILPYARLEMLATIALFAARESSVDIAVLLDHGMKPENIERCIKLGISVMVDGSKLPFEENVRLTKYYAEMAHAEGLSIEGELGSLQGVEDAFDETAVENLTDPVKAKVFVEKTGIDCLAVAIGNRHGKYSVPPVLDFERLNNIRSLIDVPVVLHGGSDLPVEMSTEAINNGIKKFNIGTDLKYAMCDTLKQVLNRKPMPFQPQDTFGVAREAVTEVTREKIRLFKNGMEF